MQPICIPFYSQQPVDTNTLGSGCIFMGSLQFIDVQFKKGRDIGQMVKCALCQLGTCIAIYCNECAPPCNANGTFLVSGCGTRLIGLCNGPRPCDMDTKRPGGVGCAFGADGVEERGRERVGGERRRRGGEGESGREGRRREGKEEGREGGGKGRRREGKEKGREGGGKGRRREGKEEGREGGGEGRRREGKEERREGGGKGMRRGGKEEGREGGGKGRRREGKEVGKSGGGEGRRGWRGK